MKDQRLPPASDFYAWDDDLGETPRGSVLRSEPLEGALGVPGADRAVRLLYATLGHHGRSVAVSGVLYLPAGEAPATGWPVVSYAHGTVGIIPEAAPSLRPMAEVLCHPVCGSTPRFLDAGYAVVCTDYEGLGAAGPHPYLHGPSLAASQIDAVRAARETTPECSATWVAVGQSEGGLATLFTAAEATGVAPELDYRGAVATAPPTEWDTLSAATSDFGRILTPLVLHAASYHDPDVEIEGWLNADGQVLLDAWRTSYLHEPGTVLAVFAELIGKPLLALGVDEASDAEAAARLAATVDFHALEVPRGRYDRPLFLAEGGADEFCVPGTGQRLAEALRDAGNTVEYHFYADTGHLDVPYAAIEDSMAFIARLFGDG